MNNNLNSAGRPRKDNIIKFSEQPKSIVSLYLTKKRLRKLQKDSHADLISDLDQYHNKVDEKQNLHQGTTESLEENEPNNVTCESHSKTGLTTFDLQDNFRKNTALSNQIKVFEFTEIPPCKDLKFFKHVDSLKLYACTYQDCTYNTKNSSNMAKHKRTHSSNKLYLCDQCTFSTKFSNSLNVHKRLHTQEKPFICSYCEYKCNSSSNLKKHISHRHYSP